MQDFLHARPTGTLLASLIGAGMLTIAAGASAQQVAYSTNFESGYVYGQNLSDQNGWTTNDESTGATYNGADIGNSDDVGFVNGFSTTTSDHVGFVGGAFAPVYAYSGSGQVYLGHGFNTNGAATFAFNADYGVTASSGSFATRDSFGFTFRTASNGTATVPVNVFSVNFVPANTSTSFDNISITSGATTIGTTTVNTSFQLGFRYHLTVNVNVIASTFSASIYAETAGGAQMGAVFPIATNVGFTGTITDIAATWNLANTASVAPANGGTLTGTNNVAFTSPGSNVLLFDNFAVTVPEPSTYAMLALGAFGLLAVRRARRAQTA